MKRVAEAVLVVCLLMVTSFLHQTTAAPSWRPQGRFGKRGVSSSFVAGESSLATSGTLRKAGRLFFLCCHIVILGDLRDASESGTSLPPSLPVSHSWQPETRFGKRGVSSSFVASESPLATLGTLWTAGSLFFLCCQWVTLGDLEDALGYRATLVGKSFWLTSVKASTSRATLLAAL